METVSEVRDRREAAGRGGGGGGVRAGWVLGGILVGAFLLRTVGTDQPFTSVFHPVNSLAAGLRLTLAPWFGGDVPLENFFVQLAVFYRGITAPLVLYADLTLLKWLGLRYSEFLFALPFALVGLLGLVALYALGRRFFGVRAGLLAALFMGLASWHVANSRTPQALVAVFLGQVLVFLALDKLFETRARRWAAWSALALTLEVMGNNGFPFTLLAVAYFWIARARESRGDWKRELWGVLRGSGFLYWAILPALAVLFQGLLFIWAMYKSQLLGLLAWSNQHSRYFLDVGPSVIIHEQGTPLSANMLGSLLNIGIGLNALFALTCLISFVIHFPRLWRFDRAGLLVFWYGVLGFPQIFFFYTYPEIAATNVAVPLSLLGAKLMSDLWERRRAWGIALAVLAAAEGLSGTLYTNFSLATPNWGLYIRAEAENARGANFGVRGAKSAASYVRSRIPKDEKVHVNAFSLLSEIYFDRQLCRCAGRGRKTLYRDGEAAGDVQWFVEYNPWLDPWGRLTDPGSYKKWAGRETRSSGEGGHLAALIQDGGLVLVKVFAREPVKAEILEHRALAAKFDEEYMRPGRFFTNRLAGMTFWMD